MKRLESLDILRGIDLFLLTVAGPIVFCLADTGDYAWEAPVLAQMGHARWAGFTVWDLIMPLFMFMSGVTIPFSLDKYRAPGQKRGAVYARIGRRFVLLWLLGMLVQGQLREFEWESLRFFSNTLQAIAVGYLFSAIFYLNTKPKAQIGIAGGLLLIYWILMMTVGGGDMSEHGNLCELVDNAVLGRHRDYASVAADGTITVSAHYTYTWIISSINFIVTVMTGMFAGEALRNKEWTEKKKMLTLLFGGASMVAAGWLWGMQMPVIKHIWTSSMVLVSSGYCFLLLVALYWLIDYKKKGKWMSFFKIWGMNSILAYTMSGVINFSSVPQELLFGLEKYVGEGWYAFIICVCCVALQFAVLKICYDRKKFFRV